MRKIGLIIFIAITVWLSCTSNGKESMVILEEEIGVEKTTNVNILYSDASIIKVRITADRLMRNPDKYEPYEEFTDGIYCEFYDNKMQVISWLEADYAVRRDRDRTITARSNVLLYNLDGQRLETPELIWNEKTEKVYSDKFVKITEANGDVTYGFGFESDQNFRKFQILSVESQKDIEELLKNIDN